MRLWHCAQHWGKVTDRASLTQCSSAAHCYECDQTMGTETIWPARRKAILLKYIADHNTSVHENIIEFAKLWDDSNGQTDGWMKRPVKSKPYLKPGWFWASGNKYVNPSCSSKANMPPPIPISCFLGPLVIMKCKITFNTPFGKPWSNIDWKITTDILASGDHYRMEGFEKGTYNRESETSFVSGLNQRLTEICLVGSKLFSMGNMTSKVARYFKRSWEMR